MLARRMREFSELKSEPMCKATDAAAVQANRRSQTEKMSRH